MTPQEIQEFFNAIENLRVAYEKYRAIQEQEHAHLSRRGPIAEWNILVRQKHVALQEARGLEHAMSGWKQRWQAMGDARQRPEFAPVRTKLSQLQTLLTRILTCDRMNESLLYSAGYLQSVIAHRSASMLEKGMRPPPPKDVD
ncbi:MAG: hypothetical protein HY360_24295 [Verrucomicrobia bacterium]|nr:hypothetical protein [Verrucomicrobiota bacterium]